MRVYSEKKGSGEPLLMIHGIACDHNFFDETANYLSQYYKVILYDRRGYGKSICKNNLEYSIKQQVQDAYSVLKEYANSPTYIVAHSAGCIIALEFAIMYPELIKGVLMIEPSFGYDKTSADILNIWNKQLNKYAEEKKITKVFSAFFEIAGIERDRKNVSSNILNGLESIKNTMLNLENFIYGELNQIQLYLPEKDKVQAIEIPIIVGVTEEKKSNLFAQIAEREAKMFGWMIQDFPGGHDSIKMEPERSAKKILEALGNIRGEELR